MSTAALLRHPARPIRPLQVGLTDDQADALNDEAERADRAAAIELARPALRRLYLDALARSAACPTPRVPATFSLNVASDGQPDHFESRLIHQPITLLVGMQLESLWVVGATMPLLRVAPADLLAARDKFVGELATEYVDAHVDGLVDAGWRAEA